MANYPLGLISGLENGNKAILGSGTYFSILDDGDEVIINGLTHIVSNVINDEKFAITTATTGMVGNMVYTNKKSIYYEYQIWKVDTLIANYDTELAGIKKTKSGTKEIEFSDSNTSLQELLRLKSFYEEELKKALDSENGTTNWTFRRMEYGTH